MSPPMQLNAHTNVAYHPTSDALDRHDYGITKNRKLASTGGGRAWSEDEEVYLLQTRLQKMPYKHIAAHLKKTELACRLHYHQLSHGSNRRKRTTSMSSTSSGHSPILPTSMPTPIREAVSRSTSPPGSSGSYGPHSPSQIQLPSIMTSSNDASPRLPAILPKPVAMSMSQLGYPTPTSETSRALAPSPLPRRSTSTCPDCIPSTLLTAILFWGAVANDYGTGASPAILEQAWKSSMVNGPAHTPITPTTSPNDRDIGYGKHDKTRISAILGIDANPRSPGEREMVRRLEEERSVGVVVV
ncbi:hypothetical protein PG993_010121 [Apiospora rasikravindrae]|uniref:Myb-like domain-containing protein n=1 Tax=Apiospora rasikravindrae TaxID=990691 RepID=A0ABR1SLD4_9PEZI